MEPNWLPTLRPKDSKWRPKGSKKQSKKIPESIWGAKVSPKSVQAPRRELPEPTESQNTLQTLVSIVEGFSTTSSCSDPFLHDNVHAPQITLRTNNKDYPGDAVKLQEDLQTCQNAKSDLESAADQGSTQHHPQRMDYSCS